MEKENREEILLDEKTQKNIKNIRSNISVLTNQLEVILQTYVNAKFPDSNDVYELSEDGTKLVMYKEGQP